MIARIFLALVGFLYVGLATWCVLAPQTTSEKVGFQLLGGSGKSEFMTVYGGLELGMALSFLLPIFKRDATEYALLSCLLIHVSLVVFRSLSFAMFENIGSMTYRLAIGEWVIAVASVAIWIVARR